MIQLQAGYVFDCVKEELIQHYGKETIEGLLKHLSFFHIETNSTINTFNNTDFEQILYVANNIISRGLPTRPSLWTENVILQTNDWTKNDVRAQHTGSIKRTLDVDKNRITSLLRALHIIDPALKRNDFSKTKITSWENAERPFEEDFLYNQIPAFLPEYWMQLFEPQRDLENLLRFSTHVEDEVDKYLNGTIQIHQEQQLDFSLEYPYPINNSRGLIVEIDGLQHKQPDQLCTDNNRDTATEIAKFGRAVRIRTSEWSSIEEKIRRIEYAANSLFIKTTEQNYNHPLYQNTEGLSALEITLMPFAIARIQKTIIHLLINGELNINAKEWNIAVLERDIPCAKIAFEDFIQLVQHLLILQGNKDVTIPQVNVFAESNERFNESRFYSKNTIDRNKTYDLFIDISVLQRTGLTQIDPTINAVSKVIIRSSHSVGAPHSFYTSTLVRYKPLGKKNRSEDIFEEDKLQVNTLEKFLHDFFRKKTFKPGQIEIINKAIQGESVIGLLPPNSGKTLIYQLAALLQPGMTLVVDPTGPLLKDQYENLLKNGIDSAVCIYPSLRKKERNIAFEKIKQAQTIFAFITSEKLQDDRFRKELKDTNKHFSYCIIDEAHCISEWGHDFRTSYLHIGKNISECGLAENKNSIPFLALTASTSYDVLSDIQCELEIYDDSVISRPDDFDRPKIQFKIIEVNVDLETEAGINESNKQLLEEAKRQQLVQLLQDILPDLDNLNENETSDIQRPHIDAGLIFYPYPNGSFGVAENTSFLNNLFPHLRIDSFLGNSTDGQDKINSKKQDLFINNQLEWLTATKTFGIGIDKPNIRHLIHFNYPASIENYYQETARAGRDGKPATAILLFNQQQFTVKDEDKTIENDEILIRTSQTKKTSIDKEILYRFHKTNFKGIHKEKQIIAEILFEIKFPARKVTNYIEERVLDEFSININLHATSNDKGKILHINPDLGSICLDEKNLPFHIVRTPLAVKVADFVKQIILSEKKEDVTPLDWLNQYMHNDFSAPGIETLLEQDQTPDTFQVIIPFTNNKTEEITGYLNDNELAFTDRIVSEAQDNCIDENEFIQQLEQKYRSIKNEPVTIPGSLKPILKKLFTEIRNRQDTLKAAYRLSVIGIIDDYTIDYNSKIITAQISKKKQGYYTGQLRKFLLRYNSSRTTEEIINQLSVEANKDNEMQQCINFLINFIYQETAQQHKDAIEAMEDACIIGLQEDGSQKFKEFVNLYMNSKYARPFYLPADTNNGLTADFAIVEKYMDLIRTEPGEISNLKHLRAAAIRSLTQYPDNFVFMLLKAFTIFSIEENNRDLIKEAQNDFVNGFYKENETTNENALYLKRKTKTFRDKIERLNTGNLDKIDEAENVVLLTMHKNWLKEFNDNFINI